ncbi:hypothetical protein PHSC3_002071 [Chlamydiales bacterium STE3]|nr:hypothetical protein PHSC3_002071 [Chlamydiales bacterium STE3]
MRIGRPEHVSRFVRSAKCDPLVHEGYSRHFVAYVDRELTIRNIARLALQALIILFAGTLTFCSKKLQIWARELFAGGEIVAINTIALEHLGKTKPNTPLPVDKSKLTPKTLFEMHLKRLLEDIKKFPANLKQQIEIKMLKETLHSLSAEDLMFLDVIFLSVNEIAIKNSDKNFELKTPTFDEKIDLNIFKVDNPYIQFIVSPSASELTVSVACWPPVEDPSGVGLGNWSIGENQATARTISILNDKEINILLLAHIKSKFKFPALSEAVPLTSTSPPFTYGYKLKLNS